MGFTRKLVGYGVAGMLVMSTWDGLVGPYGIIGGIFAAVLIIFPTWVMNHYNNLVDNKAEAAFVDQGLAIAFTGIFRDLFMAGDVGIFASSVPTFPTFIVIVLGAAAGGFVAAKFEQDMGL